MAPPFASASVLFVKSARDIAALLACPVCRGDLSPIAEEVACSSCGRRYPVVGRVPILIHPDSRFFGTARTTSEDQPRGFRKGLLERLPSNLPMTTWIDKSMFRALENITPEMLVLNLGSGRGTFDKYIPASLRFINLDVSLTSRSDVVADGHFLPFRDSSLDAVFSNAVLEHVERPWVVADEIWRVLKPGGSVLVNVPFLNVIHDADDYYRYTDKGLRVLFSKFDEVRAGVSAGPSSFFGPFVVEYVLCFVPTRPLQRVARQLLSILVWPLKYADFLIRKNPRIRTTADAFYFVGTKR